MSSFMITYGFEEGKDFIGKFLKTTGLNTASLLVRTSWTKMSVNVYRHTAFPQVSPAHQIW